MIKLRFAGVAALFFAAALSACGGGGSIVTVNGQAISQSMLDSKLEGSSAARGEVQQMVTNLLIDQYAQKNHIDVSAADIAKIEDQYKAQYPAGQWDQLLKARGLTEQDVQDLIRHQIVLDRAVGGSIHITEKQIADYFAKNHAQFDQPAQARSRHILVATLAMAQKIEADLKAGKDFAAEAKQYSIDPGTKDKGGELGWYKRGFMVAAYEKVEFSAPIGQISPPVKSPFGWHIIQVEERKPAVLATLASAHDRIAQTLRQQQEAPLIPQFLQQLQLSAKIQVNDSRFAGLFPTPLPAISAPPAPTTAPTK